MGGAWEASLMSGISVFYELEDPRADNARHRLGDLLMLAVASALCGGETSVDFAQFARSKRHVMAQVIGDYAPPSHDTFSRVLRLLDAKAFEAAFARFAAAFADHVTGVVALDGKAMRRAYEAGLAASPPLIVTAWASQARIALAAAMPGPDSNETEAALSVIGCLDLKGCIVTADALHCHKRMASAVMERGGDYALCLKGNQSKLHRLAQAALEGHPQPERHETLQEKHGRREWRSARVVPAPGLGDSSQFAGVQAVAEVVSQRGDAPHRRRFYLLSATLSAANVLEVVRAHWSIENNLHWMLDVLLREDSLRSRLDNAPANIGLLTRLALNIAKSIDDPKTPIRRRFKRCAWEDDYLISAIAQMR